MHYTWICLILQTDTIIFDHWRLSIIVMSSSWDGCIRAHSTHVIALCTIFVFICDFTLVNPVSSEILIVTVFLPWITSINNLTDIPHPFGLLSCCAKALYPGTPRVNTGPLHHENCSLVGDGDVRFILAFSKVDSSSESSPNHAHWQAFLCNELHAP